MKKVRLILLCVIFLACFAIPTTFFMSKQGPQITEEQYERLQPGMTEEEVAEFLGGPPAERRGAGWAWYGRQGRIDVLFDYDGKLYLKAFGAPPTIWERIECIPPFFADG